MKYIKQFEIILFISLMGEILYKCIPLPIPASIYGIIILFFFLEKKIIPVSSIKETSYFLVESMPIMFIPAAAGIMSIWDILRSSWAVYITIVLISTCATMAVSGKTTQILLQHLKESKKHE